MKVKESTLHNPSNRMIVIEARTHRGDEDVDAIDDSAIDHASEVAGVTCCTHVTLYPVVALEVQRLEDDSTRIVPVIVVGGDVCQLTKARAEYWHRTSVDRTVACRGWDAVVDVRVLRPEIIELIEMSKKLAAG